MVELMKKEDITKRHDHYLHKTEIIYPIENVKNMKKSWESTIEKCQDFLDKFDENLKAATEIAEKTFDSEIKKQMDNIKKVDSMSDDEKLKYWLKNFAEEKKIIEEDFANRDNLIKQMVEENTKLLTRYKQQYEQDMKSKKEALKKWNK